MEKYLLINKVATEEEISEIRKEINNDLDKAIEFAEASPTITAEEVYENIYVK